MNKTAQKLAFRDFQEAFHTIDVTNFSSVQSNVIHKNKEFKPLLLFVQLVGHILFLPIEHCYSDALEPGSPYSRTNIHTYGHEAVPVQSCSLHSFMCLHEETT